MTDGERDPGVLAERLTGGDRTALARAITMVESSLDDDQRTAYELLRRVMPATGDGQRIGISGPPGVGKSTFIDRFGMLLVERGHRVAVLAVDPTSSRSGGSILGDKSRMHRLAQSPAAFIRPSPSGLDLGGVTRRTREAMYLCEAAGFDRVLIETVGVGQSEIEVAAIVDTFVLLVQPGAGDELQGIKKGVVELADVLAVNKSDAEHLAAARETQAEISAALRYLRPRSEGWQPRSLPVSALTGDGLPELAARVEEHREHLAADGRREARRREDLLRWLHDLAEERLLEAFRSDPEVRSKLAAAVDDVAGGRRSALDAAVVGDR